MSKLAQKSTLSLLVLLVSLCASTSRAQLVQQQQQQQFQQAAADESQREPAAEPYSFSYSAQSIGGFSSHQESGDASGRVTGFYTIQGDDGRERRVDYVADEHGYRASVSSNEVGTRTGNSAGASYQVQPPSAGQLEAAKVSFEQYQQLEEQHANELARIQSRQSSFESSRADQQQQQAFVGQRQRASSSSFVNNRNASTAVSRQSREPDARDFPQPIATNQNSLDSQRATWQTRLAGQEGTQLAFPRQQLELQFRQQAKQLTNQDYPRQQQQQQRSAFENTSQFLIDEPQQPQYLAPQVQQQQRQPQQQPLPLPSPGPFSSLSPQANQTNNQQVVGAGTGLANVSQGDYQQQQQQQDNIINEPVGDSEVTGPVDLAEEIPRQPEQISPFRDQQQVYNEAQLQQSSRPLAPNGFLSINLTNDNNQSEKTKQNNRDQQQPTTLGDAKQSSVDYSNYGSVVVSPKQPATALADQQHDFQQNGGLDQDSGWRAKLVLSTTSPEKQQEVPNSVNQIIENYGKQQQQTNDGQRVVLADTTSRPALVGVQVAAKQQQQEFFRQASRFGQEVARPTLAPAPAAAAATTLLSIIRQTTTTTPDQLVYTTRFYQPTTTTDQPITATEAPTPTTTARPARQQQQQQRLQQFAAVKGGKIAVPLAGQQNSALGAIFRKKEQATGQQSGFGQSPAGFGGGNRPDNVITTTRAPLRLPPPAQVAPFRNQQQRPLIENNNNQQQQQQRFNSEAPYSIYQTTEQPNSSIKHANQRNKTSFASQQQPATNNNNIKFGPTNSAAAIELQTVGNDDGQLYQNSPTKQQQQQQQQWKGTKGGRARGGAKQFWQADSNKTGRFLASSSTASADDYATSLGYGNRVTAPAINLAG